MKLLYLFPALLYSGLLLTIGLSVGFGGLMMEAWLYLVLFYAAGVLLCRKNWWGCLPGMAAGSVIVYLFNNTHVQQPVDIRPLGIGIRIYFVVMGIICYKLNRQK